MEMLGFDWIAKTLMQASLLVLQRSETTNVALVTEPAYAGVAA